ncbi:ATP-binding protein [Qipengyuania spongiae]|uniref:histidine kinase n=1 Tax=Qipengyuania spongiae TaxID=2909673 RepID=A0ABY5SZN1_9SPHN|nr:ATP-binding protein [Qipengyuania spongiae]UVI39775.1 ATP-binding protein [Qipengyuania spongiae]
MRPSVRLWPRSLLGQTLLATALALLAAQAISTLLLFRAAEERRETALVNAAAFRLIGGAQFGSPDRPLSGEQASRERPDRDRDRWRENPRGNRSGFPRRFGYRLSDTSPLLPGEIRDAAREAELSEILARQGIEIAELVVTERMPGSDPVLRDLAARAPRLRTRLAAEDRALLVVGLRREGADGWEVGRIPIRERGARVVPAILLQTLVLFVVLMGLLWLVLRRITRPLADLRERTARFSASGTPSEPLAARGPSDISSLIAAHNAMEARIGAMLDEKDVMLGAIGHDLKTPLAALRVRIEAVGDEDQRERMATTIEELVRTLDEILELARIGRTDAPPERAELSALAASVVEEFEDMGEPVAMEDGPRLSAPVHITWLKRGLRNLVANALRYGGGAEVSVLREGEAIVLRVEDAGPGIPEDRIAAMLEPFVRGETSRNRETGGAGLGLTLARAVAEQHGGALVLANRPGSGGSGGLRAELRLPA